MPAISTLYEDDFYAWSLQQAALLRAGALDQADLAHIAEEIESMGKTEKRELVSRLTILLLHLLKWEFQPERRSKSWELSADSQRVQITLHLDDNPSLKHLLPKALADSYRLAVIEARKETGLPKSAFPPACPYTFEQMMDEGFWPE